MLVATRTLFTVPPSSCPASLSVRLLVSAFSSSFSPASSAPPPPRWLVLLESGLACCWEGKKKRGKVPEKEKASGARERERERVVSPACHLRIILGIDGACVIWSILAPAAEISVASPSPPPSSETKPIHGLQAKQGERPGGGGRDGRRGRCGCVPGPARLVDNPRLPPDESPSLQVRFPSQHTPAFAGAAPQRAKNNSKLTISIGRRRLCVPVPSLVVLRQRHIV